MLLKTALDITHIFVLRINPID